MPSAAPAGTSAPVVSGTATRGATLTASPGAWNPAGTSYAYQWQRSTNGGSGWSNITGAGASSYTLATADAKAEVRVIVTASNAYGKAAAASAPTGAVRASPPANTTVPTVIGTAQSGAKLSATTGSWAGTGNSYAYQWQRKSGSGFVNIAGAKKQMYVAAQADQGATLRVVVTAANSDGTVTKASAATKAVASTSRAAATALKVTAKARPKKSVSKKKH